MTTTRGVAIAAAAILLWLSPGLAADGAGEDAADEAKTIRVEVRVTFASGDSVYVDKGRGAGLEIGDIVVLEDPTRGRLEAELTVVATTSARARMRSGQEPPEPGVRGEVIIPSDRVEPEEAPAPGPGAGEGGKETPAHPPWKGEIGERKPDTPLLAPAFHQDPSERPVTWRGRIFTHLLTNVDREGDADSRYFLARLGADVSATNLFGRGGLFRIAADVEDRKVDVDGGRDRNDGDFRLDRFYYEWGGGWDASLLVDIGRYLPHQTPELGIVDGLGVVYDIGFGSLGVDLGALPEPQPDRASFEDWGGTISWRYASGERDSFTATAAYQQTWHKGDQDRSLLLLKTTYTPTLDAGFFASVWIDHYGSNDVIKSSGFELTELHLNGWWRFAPDHRARLGYSRIRWPELLRNEFPEIAARLIEDNLVNRVDLSTTHDLTDHWRLDTRIGWWGDQDDSGVTGHLTASVRNLVASGMTLSATAFRTDGSVSRGYGLRLQARQSLTAAFLSLGYEISKREIDSTAIGGGDLTQHAIFASVDWSFGRNWSLSVNGDYRFGDAQDAVSLGVYVQYRF